MEGAEAAQGGGSVFHEGLLDGVEQGDDDLRDNPARQCGMILGKPMDELGASHGMGGGWDGICGGWDGICGGFL